MLERMPERDSHCCPNQPDAKPPQGKKKEVVKMIEGIPKECNSHCPTRPDAKYPPGEFGTMIEDIRLHSPESVLPNTCRIVSACPVKKEGLNPATCQNKS